MFKYNSFYIYQTLGPCNFSLFLNLKIHLKSGWFKNVEDISQKYDHTILKK